MVTGHYVYVLRCSDDSLYTGYTTDVSRRVEEHQNEEAAKYTRGRTPVELVYVEEHGSRGDALSREHEVKQLTRDEKDTLVSDGDALSPIDI